MKRSTLYTGLAALTVMLLLIFKSVPTAPTPTITSETPPKTTAVDPQVGPVVDEHPSAESLRAVGALIDDLGDAVAADTPRDNQQPGAAVGPSPTDQTLTGLGVVLNPVTGGLSSIIAGLVMGIGRLGREVKRRGDAIVEIDTHPTTPPAESQTITAEGYRTVQRIKKKARR